MFSHLKKAASLIAETATKAATSVSETATLASSAITDTATQVGSIVAETAIQTSTTITETATKAAVTVAENTMQAGSAVADGVTKTATAITESATQAGSNIADSTAKLGDQISSAWPTVEKILLVGLVDLGKEHLNNPDSMRILAKIIHGRLPKELSYFVTEDYIFDKITSNSKSLLNKASEYQVQQQLLTQEPTPYGIENLPLKTTLSNSDQF